MIAAVLLLRLVPLVVLCSFGVSGQWNSGSPQVSQCPAPLVWNNCGTACKETCAAPRPQICTLQCVFGCFCPPDRPIETKDGNNQVTCVSSRDHCCTGGQVWADCGSACNRTCQTPDPVCTKQCVSRCQCPPEAPIWNNGQCVALSQCICPDGACSKSGCYGCNRCRCRANGAACTRKSCPDPHTSQGFAALYSNGCWRQSPSGDQCIFYSPCIDQGGDPDCVSNPFGFCNGCNKCQCVTDAQGTGLNAKCAVNIISCQQQLNVSIDQGCWTLVKDECRFTYPCLKSDPTNCAVHSQDGERSCERCNSCQCVHGAKLCTSRSNCPDPYNEGCYVPRSVPGERAGCYYVSPCPVNSTVSPLEQCRANPTGFVCNTCASCSCKRVLNNEPCAVASCLEPKQDFCYKFNEGRQLCEFISPCPTGCNAYDIECSRCNECRCSSGGSTNCSRDQCVEPTPPPVGCYYPGASGCEFRIPCPADAITDSAAYCSANPGASFCPANDCNQCRCSPDGSGVLGCTRMGCPRRAVNVPCWKPENGQCVYKESC